MFLGAHRGVIVNRREQGDLTTGRGEGGEKTAGGAPGGVRDRIAAAKFVNRETGRRQAAGWFLGPLANHCLIGKKYEQILGGAFLIQSSPFEDYKNKSRLRIANKIHREKKRIVNSQQKKNQ